MAEKEPIVPVLLFVAFIAIPLLELFVISQVAQVISLGPTIVLLVVDSLVGAWLVKREGRRAWEALRDAFSSGGWPADEVTQGGLVIFGGALLLTPGFVTDVVGLACVIPPTRRIMSSVLRRWTAAWATSRGGAGRTGAATAFWTAGGRRDRGLRSGSTNPGTTASGPGGASRARRPANRPAPDAGPADTPDVEVLGVERDDPPR